MLAMRQMKLGGVMAAVVLVVAALSFGSYALAQDVNNSTNTLRVSPVRSDIEIAPGGTDTVQTVVTNLTDQPITVRPIINDFIAGDERGTPALILDEDEFAPTHSLKRFITPLDDVTIPANSAANIQVEVVVPESAQAGGYFGAVRFAPTSPEDGGQVNLSSSVASLVLLTVPGDLVEQLELTTFSVAQNNRVGGYFFSADDLNLSVRFENKGNVQAGPFGKISLLRGDEVVYERDFNPQDPRDMILPNSARQWDVPLADADGFGKYTLAATFTYGESNQTIEVTDSFWVIPWAIIIAAAVGVLLVIGIIVLVILAIRRKTRRRESAARGRIR